VIVPEPWPMSLLAAAAVCLVFTRRAVFTQRSAASPRA